MTSPGPVGARKTLGICLLWLTLLVLDLLAARGVMMLEFQHGLDRIFSGGGSARHATYLRHLGNQGDADGLLILVEGDDLGQSVAQAALIDLVLELQLTPGVAHVLSPFSVPIPDAGGGVVTLDQLRGDPAQSWATAQSAQPQLARVLSPDRSTALITLRGEMHDKQLLRIEALADRSLEPAGLDHELTGVPVVLSRSSAYLLQDFWRLTLIGAALGLLVVIVALRGWWIAMSTLLSSGTALLWGIGSLGWLGVQINMISIALPILILVLSLSDGVHLGLEQRTQLRGTSSHPIRQTLLRIGPAVLLTSLTTSVAFMSLRLSGSAAISDMGIGGAVSVVVASFGVLMANGVLGTTVLAVIGQERLKGLASASPRAFFDWHWMADFGQRAARPVAIVGLGLTVAACVFYFLAAPRFMLYENLSRSDPAIQALERISEKLGPAEALHVSVDLNGKDPVVLARTVADVIRVAEPALQPLSIATLAETAVVAEVALDVLLDPLPPDLRKGLVGEATGQISVSVPFRYENSAATRALVDRIEAELSGSVALSDHQIDVTGIVVMTAYESQNMIRVLSQSLLLSMLVVGLVILLWLRSLKAGLISLAANLLPIAVVGALLGLLGTGVSLAAGIAFTLAFGVAVDDTIHVMNRYRLQRRGGPDALTQTMNEVTAPIVITSLVLIAGLCGSLGATLRSVEEFGILAIFVFVLAMVSDLVFLPALIKRFRL